MPQGYHNPMIRSVLRCKLLFLKLCFEHYGCSFVQDCHRRRLFIILVMNPDNLIRRFYFISAPAIICPS